MKIFFLSELLSLGQRHGNRWGQDLDCMTGAPSIQIQLIYCSDRLIGRVRTGVAMQQDDVISKFSTAFGSDRGLQFRTLHITTVLTVNGFTLWSEMNQNLTFHILKKCKHNLTVWWFTFEFLSHV
jgi:hypothetical protein